MQLDVMAMLLLGHLSLKVVSAAILAGLLVGFLYFFPSLIAMSRHKRNIASIVVLNLFLGFTIIGWVLALVWAFAVDRQEEPQAYTSPRYESGPRQPIGLPAWAVASLVAFTVLGMMYLAANYVQDTPRTHTTEGMVSLTPPDNPNHHDSHAPSGRVSCRVCVTFNGRRDCRTASAVTQQKAVRTAVNNACALLAAGVTETTQCENTKPDSVDWLR